MRGRKPSVLSLAPSDEDRLHSTAHSDSLPWYIKCGGPEFCWLSLPVSASVMSPLKWNVSR